MLTRNYFTMQGQHSTELIINLVIISRGKNVVYIALSVLINICLNCSFSSPNMSISLLLRHPKQALLNTINVILANIYSI